MVVDLKAVHGYSDADIRILESALKVEKERRIAARTQEFAANVTFREPVIGKSECEVCSGAVGGLKMTICRHHTDIIVRKIEEIY